MAEHDQSPGTPADRGGSAGPGGAAAPRAGSSAGERGPDGRSRSSGRNRGRKRNRNRPASTGSGNAGRAGGTDGGGGGGGGGGGTRGGQGRPAPGSGGGGSRARQRARSRSTRSASSGAPSVAAPAPVLPVPGVEEAEAGLGALRVLPGEVAANRRRALVLCVYAALAPALILGALFGAATSLLVGVAVFVACGALVVAVLWRISPSVALGRIGAVPVVEQDHPGLFNVTEGLCATFGLPTPAFRVLDDDVPNACALGRDAHRAEIVVTSGLLRRADPIELEGVLAHELAHVKRGDNGVACVGITLASLVGGESTLRRCLGEGREYRADVVGASAVRYPRGLLRALEAMMDAPPPAAGSFFAAPSRFGRTRWVWIDPSVGHRDDVPVPGDLDATSVRAAALSEW